MTAKFNTAFIDLLYNCSHNQRFSLMKTASNNQLKLILELVYNLVYGNIPISTDTKKLLSRYKPLFRTLTSSTSLDTKKKLLLKHYNVFILILRAIQKFIEDER